MRTMIKSAKNKEGKWIELRRELHKNAEVGFDLPKTREMIWERLIQLGYAPKRLGKSGVLAEVGKGKRAFLLRADMDALPIKEQTGEAFACKTGNMHACGHDMHATALLGAAELLKERESQLNGRILLLFQPAEEVLEGANDCIQTGFLEEYNVQGAATLHVMTDVPFESGVILLPSAGVGAPAADFFRVEIRGKACHGATPQNGIDALLAGAQTVTALQAIASRECSAVLPVVLTIGQMQAGNASNVVAERCVLKGTMRTFDEEARKNARERIEEICKWTAKSMRASAKVTFEGGAPTLINDGELLEKVQPFLREILGEDRVIAAKSDSGVVAKSGGSEDFAYFTQRIPALMFALAAGKTEEGYAEPLHHAKVKFDERAIAYGATALATIAFAFFK